MKHPAKPPAQAAPRTQRLDRGLWLLCVLLGFGLSVALGAGLFAIIFFGPAWVSGNHDILLAWGWIGTPLGFLAGFGLFALGVRDFPNAFYRGFGGRVV